MNRLNSPQIVREEDQLDLTSLKEYLLDHLDTIQFTDELSLKQFAGGASNLTYEVSWGDHKAILRTPPRGANIKSAHDMGREFRVLSQLENHFQYSPKPILYCDDVTVLGREFYMMEKIEGYIVRKEFPFPVDEQKAQEICKSLINVHASLHDIDIEETGLISLGHPKGYIRRQIDGWNKRYIAAKTNGALAATHLMNWLEDNIPEDQDQCLIHNDYKLDNVVFNPENTSEIISVLDWEMTTVGSPLMDLGCSMAYWIEATDPKPMQMLRMMPTHLPGMMTRQQLIDYYAKIRNIDVENFEYFYIFGLFRLAVIVQQIFQRYDLGKTTNPAFAPFGEIAKVLINTAQKKI